MADSVMEEAIDTLKIVLGDGVASDEDLRQLLAQNYGDPNLAANVAFERLSKGYPSPPFPSSLLLIFSF